MTPRQLLTVRVVGLAAMAITVATIVMATRAMSSRDGARGDRRPSGEGPVGSGTDGGPAGEATRAQPAPPTPLVRLLPAAIAVAEVHGRSVALLEHTYPGVPAVRATDGSVTVRWPGHLPRFKFYISGDTSRRELAALLATSEAPYAKAAVAYLAHMETGLARIEALQLYLARDDYRDDEWARLLEEDGSLRAWFDEHRRRLAALRAAIAQTWAAELTDGAEAHHRPSACGGGASRCWRWSTPTIRRRTTRSRRPSTGAARRWRARATCRRWASCATTPTACAGSRRAARCARAGGARRW